MLYDNRVGYNASYGKRQIITWSDIAPARPQLHYVTVR